MFSFVSRDFRLLEEAEDLCSSPSKCLTTLFVDDYSDVVSHMGQAKYSKYQVNIMMIPTNPETTAVITLYCPFYATKFKKVNAWNPLKSSLLFRETKTDCGHPLTGESQDIPSLKGPYTIFFLFLDRGHIG